MQDIIARLGSDDIVGLISVLSVAVVVLAMFSIFHWRKLRQTELETGLKQDMLNRGFSAEQIKCVLEASGTKRSGEEKVKTSPTGDSKQHEEKEEILAAARRIEAFARNHAKEALKKVADRL
jgi:hypothetical protein